MPPLLLVAVVILPSAQKNSSLAALPRILASAKPAPNSTPFTAGTAKSAEESTFSTPPNHGSPIPAGKPTTAVSSTPPTLSPSAFAAVISFIIFSLTPSSSTANSFCDTAFISSAIFRNSRSVTPAMLLMCVPIYMPLFLSAEIATAPAATIPAVILPLKCPPPR